MLERATLLGASHRDPETRPRCEELASVWGEVLKVETPEHVSKAAGNSAVPAWAAGGMREEFGVSRWLVSNMPSWLLLLGLIALVAGGAVLIQLFIRHRFPRFKGAENNEVTFVLRVVGFVFAF